MQVVVTGSDFDRGRELSLPDYEALPVAEQGVIDYFKNLSGGREILVEQSVYERLEDERRGAIRYYSKERPRLAEGEGWWTVLPGQDLRHLLPGRAVLGDDR